MNHSTQRDAILAELRSLTCHPTADELHARLRNRMPRLSLGTVYRNLELLAEHRVILKLATAGSQKRFDGNADPHHHMRCDSCGRIRDMHGMPHDGELEAVLVKILASTGCHAYQLELAGVCDECRGKAVQRTNRTKRGGEKNGG